MQIVEGIKKWLTSVESMKIQRQAARIGLHSRDLGVVNRVVENKNAEIAALRAERDKWKQAVIEAAVVNGTYTKEDESDPVGAINKMLAYVAQVAESPEANPKIAALHQRVAELEAMDLSGDHCMTCGDMTNEGKGIAWQHDRCAENIRLRAELEAMNEYVGMIEVLINERNHWQDEAVTATKMKDDVLRAWTKQQEKLIVSTEIAATKPTPHEPTNEEVEALAKRIATCGNEKRIKGIGAYGWANSMDAARTAFEHFRDVQCQ